MKLIVGLGNPGKEYEKTRHNVGFIALDALASKLQATGYKRQDKFKAQVIQVGDFILVKPQTFMNRSGEAVAKIRQFYKVEISDLWVIHDDLDINLGEYKIQLGKGPKIHNGLNSIEEALGTEEFWRVRIGTENRTTVERQQISGENYVLQAFGKEERQLIEQTVGRAAEEVYTKVV